MKTHTTAFKNKVKDFGREIDSIITCNIGGIDIELSNAMLNSVSPHYEGGILKSVMKQLDVDSNVEVPEETVINYTFGVKVRNDIVVNYRDNYDYVDFGEYIVYKSEKQEDTNSWKLTCYDKMLYTMKDYVKLNITYPITIRDYINTLCNFLGLTFKNASDTFANYDKQIQNELYMSYNVDKKRWESLGYTFRDVFDELAQATASTICINEEDGELEIRYINDTEDTINEKYLKDINVNFGKKFGKVNSIVLARSADSDVVYKQDEESVAENGLCEIKISDNQIMNFNDRSDYLPDILDTLDGLEYYINDFSSTGITYYNVCDRYNIQIANNTYSCIMFNDEVNVTQGLEENIYTEMPGESVTDYSKADKTDRKINQTYLIVNKQLGEIIAHVDDVDENYAEMKLTVDGLTLDVKKTGNNILKGTELYDLEEWGYWQYEVIISDYAPPTSKSRYWRCTRTYDNYINGVIYDSTIVANTWTATDKTMADLKAEKTNNAEKISNSWTMNNFVSQRAMQIGDTSTDYYAIDKTKGQMTFSAKVENLVANGITHIRIIQTSEVLGTSLSIDDFEIGKTDYNSLTDISNTVNIITSNNIIYAYLGAVVPEEEMYWLQEIDTSRFQLYKRQIEDNVTTWVEVKEPKIVRIQQSNIYYTATKYHYANNDIETCIYTYAGSDLRSDNLDKVNAKYVRVEMRVKLDDNETAQDGTFTIGDIKLEYGSVASYWSNNQNELYGRNYKMDTEGFKVSRGDNTLLLDEDELTGFYKTDVIFQINQDRTFSKNGVFEITNQNGLVTKKLSNGMYVRYIE